MLRPVAPNDRDCWSDFGSYSTYRFRVLLSLDEERAIYVGSLPLDEPDHELESIAAELQRPVVIFEPPFGELVLDRTYDRFECTAEWLGQATELVLPVNDDKPPEASLRIAHSLWTNAAAWNERIQQAVVTDLLQLKNGAWLQEDEQPVTAAEFLARTTLTTISISEDAEFEFWCDDGDLFWGHSIMVRGDLENGPTDVGIHG